MANAALPLSEVIAGAQRGDPACFDILIDRYAGRLYGYFCRMTASRSEAEDLLQEVFVRLVKAIGAYDHHDHFEAFLFRIAGNLCRDRVRRKRRRREVRIEDAEQDGGSAILAEAVAPATRRPDHALELSEQMDRVQAALTVLPQAEREVLVLRHFSQMSFQQIAAMMGTPVGTALARAHRGLNRLRDLLSD